MYMHFVIPLNVASYTARVRMHMVHFQYYRFLSLHYLIPISRVNNLDNVMFSSLRSFHFFFVAAVDFNPISLFSVLLVRT